MTTLDSTQSQTVDAKKLHPDAHPAGSDAAHEQETKKPDAPVGGNFVANSLADLKHIFSSDKPKPDISDGHTLTIPPLDHNGEPVKAGETTQAKAVEKPALPGEKPALQPAVAEKAAVVGADGKTTAPVESKTVPPPEAPQVASMVKTDTTLKSDTSPVSAAAVKTDAVTPDAKTASPGVFDTLASGLQSAESLATSVAASVEKVAVNAAVDVAGQVWDAASNYYGTGMLDDLGQQASSLDKDNHVVLDQTKVQQAADMQAMSNVFQGKSGEVHRDLVNKMFSEDSQSAEKGVTTEAYKALDAQRTEFIKEGHKPGESWSDKTGSYSLDKQGNLLEASGSESTREIKWVGQDGQTYERNAAGQETWTKDGREIKQLGEKQFEYKNSKGESLTVDGKNGSTVLEVASGTVTSFKENLGRITQDEAAKIKDGTFTDPSQMGFTKRDGHGHQLFKDGNHGLLIYSEDHKNLRIKDGQVYSEDAQGRDTKIDPDKVPSYVTRNADGTLQFGDVKIAKDDSITASSNNFHMADRAHTATAGTTPQEKTTVSVANGKQTVAVGDGLTETISKDSKGQTSVNLADGSGKPPVNYNFETGTMRGDGITFTNEGSHIQGSNFAVSHNGQIESSSQWMAANRSNGIYDAGDAYIPSSSYSSDSSDTSSYQSTTSDQTSTDGTDIADGTDGSYGNQNQVDASLLNADGSPKGDDNPDDSYKAFDQDKELEEKSSDHTETAWERITKKWNASQRTETGEENTEALDGSAKVIAAIKQGKVIEVPEALKLKMVAEHVNVGEILGVMKAASTGEASTGNIAELQTAIQTLGAAEGILAFDADGYMTKLEGAEHSIDERQGRKTLAEDQRLAANDERSRFSEHGKPVLASNQLADQRESA